MLQPFLTTLIKGDYIIFGGMFELLKRFNYGIYAYYDRHDRDPQVYSLFLVGIILSASILVFIGTLGIIMRLQLINLSSCFVVGGVIFSLNYFIVYKNNKYVEIFKEYDLNNLRRKTIISSWIFVAVMVILCLFFLGLIRWIKFGTI